MKYFFSFILMFSIMNIALSEQYKEGDIGYSYPDEDSREFLIKVLKSLGKDYYFKEIKGKLTIFWHPDNDAQEQEVSERVSQFNFVKDVCPNLPMPLPSQPSKSNLSCAK